MVVSCRRDKPRDQEGIPKAVHNSVTQFTPELALCLTNKFPLRKIGEDLTPEQFTRWRNEKLEFVAGEEGLRKILSGIKQEEEVEAQNLAADPFFMMIRRATPSYRNMIFGLTGKMRNLGKPVREWLYGPETMPQVIARADQIVSEVNAKYPLTTGDKILFATPAIAIDVGNILLEFGIAGVFLEALGVGGVGAQVIKSGWKASLIRHVPAAALLFGTRRFIEGVAKDESVGEATIRSLPEAGIGAVVGAAGATIETFSPPVIAWLSKIKDSNAVRYHMMMGKAWAKLGKGETGKEHFKRAWEIFRTREPQQAANLVQQAKLLQQEAEGKFAKRVNLKTPAKPGTTAIVQYELAGKTPAEAEKLAAEATRSLGVAGKAAVTGDPAAVVAGKITVSGQPSATPAPKPPAGPKAVAVVIAGVGGPDKGHHC